MAKESKPLVEPAVVAPAAPTLAPKPYLPVEAAVAAQEGPPARKASEAKALSPRFRVRLGDASEVIEARDANEAWAKFCDGRKSWPSPKVAGRTVEAL